MDNNQNLNIGKVPGNVVGDNTQKETGTTVMENRAAKEAELNAPYTDKRTVTIAPVQQFSAYRRANIKSMPPRRNIIGSSISSTRILSSNKDEVEKYYVDENTGEKFIVLIDPRTGKKREYYCAENGIFFGNEDIHKVCPISWLTKYKRWYLFNMEYEHYKHTNTYELHD